MVLGGPINWVRWRLFGHRAASSLNDHFCDPPLPAASPHPLIAPNHPAGAGGLWPLDSSRERGSRPEETKILKFEF